MQEDQKGYKKNNIRAEEEQITAARANDCNQTFAIPTPMCVCVLQFNEAVLSTCRHPVFTSRLHIQCCGCRQVYRKNGSMWKTQTPSVRANSSSWRDTISVVTKTTTQQRLRCNAVSRVDNAMACHRTGYGRHGIQMPIRTYQGYYQRYVQMLTAVWNLTPPPVNIALIPQQHVIHQASKYQSRYNRYR